MSWELQDFNGPIETSVELFDHALLPTGSHNPDKDTGEQCMVVSDMDAAIEIVDATQLQVVICTPPDVIIGDLEGLDRLSNPSNPFLLRDRITSLGRTPLMFCNTTRSPNGDLAVTRARLGQDHYGICNVKLEVTKTILSNDYHRLVPVDEEVIVANRILANEGFNTLPLMSCYPGVNDKPTEVAHTLIGDGANGLRLCVGGVGANTGVEDEVLLGRVIETIREEMGESYPIIAECGITPASIRRAIHLGATAALANYYVASSADPVAAAIECVEAANQAYELRAA